MTEFDGFTFWKRFDALKPQCDLKEFVKNNNLDYVRITNQRSDCRIPKTNDLYAISKALNVSMEYLLTGEGSNQIYPPRIQAVIEILIDDESKLNAVCTLLQIPTEEAGTSGTRAV